MENSNESDGRFGLYRIHLLFCLVQLQAIMCVFIHRRKLHHNLTGLTIQWRGMSLSQGILQFLPPANEVFEGYVFTPVCQSFCSRGGQGGRGSTWAGTPQDQVHHHPGTRYTPQTRYTPPGPGTPPWDQVLPGTRYTPRDQVHPPGPGTPLDQVHPPGPGTPPEQYMLGDMGNKRAVCILLECILVGTFFNPCEEQLIPVFQNSISDLNIALDILLIQLSFLISPLH